MPRAERRPGNQEAPVQFLVGAHALVAGSLPLGGGQKAAIDDVALSLMFLSLYPFPFFSLKIGKGKKTFKKNPNFNVTRVPTCADCLPRGSLFGAGTAARGLEKAQQPGV